MAEAPMETSTVTPRAGCGPAWDTTRENLKRSPPVTCAGALRAMPRGAPSGTEVTTGGHACRAALLPFTAAVLVIEFGAQPAGSLKRISTEGRHWPGSIVPRLQGS